MEVRHFSTKGKEREFAEEAKRGDSVVFSLVFRQNAIHRRKRTVASTRT